MIVRNCPGSQSACSRSKLKAWPSPSGLAYRCRRRRCTQASATADPRRVVLVEDLPPLGVDVVHLVPVPERVGAVGGSGPSARAARLASGSVRSLARPWATSTRKPSTPRSDQNRSVVRKSSRTSRLSQFRSGCSAANRCRYHCPSPDPGPGRAAERDSQSDGGSDPSGPVPSRKMYRSRAGDPVGAASASRNHACRFEVWFGTMSTMTLMPGGVQRGDHLVEVRERAQARVDVAVVVDVVAAVDQGRGVERAQPDRVDPRARPGTAMREMIPGRSPTPSPLESAKLRG